VRLGAGRFRNAPLPAAGRDVRPVPARLRTSLFSVLGARVEGARVLDLCAGVGALGLEALSRGASRVVLVDRARGPAAALRAWVERRGLSREAVVVEGDARRGGWPEGPYDLVFLDPPFPAWDGDGADARAFLERAVAALAPGGVVALKAPARAAVPEDPAWRVLDRRAQGDVSYALVARAPVRAAGTESPDPVEGGAPAPPAETSS
jgi:16S rRNA (guanine966-N2)-methyltransferase